MNNLRDIRDGKNCTWPNLRINNIYSYDLDSTLEQLGTWCTDCDFVFNLAGGESSPEHGADAHAGLRRYPYQ